MDSHSRMARRLAARSPRWALVASTALALSGCVTEPTAASAPRGVAQVGAHGFVAPTEELADELDAHARAVRGGRDLEVFAREAEWFGGVGEPAYPTLLELAADRDVRVASFGLATLGAQRDARLLAPLKAKVAPPEPGPLRLEYARALVALGDWSEVPTLLTALEAEDVRTRGSALKALRDATGETHGFHPQGTPAERATAVERWRAWWDARASDPNLAPVRRR